jgi:hypothetical protein
VHEFSQLLVPLPSHAAPNRQDILHIPIKQAFAQDALPDHPRRPEEKNVHLFNASCWDMSNRAPVSLSEMSHSFAATAASLAWSTTLAGADETPLRNVTIG